MLTIVKKVMKIVVGKILIHVYVCVCIIQYDIQIIGGRGHWIWLELCVNFKQN